MTELIMMETYDNMDFKIIGVISYTWPYLFYVQQYAPGRVFELGGLKISFILFKSYTFSRLST